MNVCSRVVHTCIPYIWFRLIASCVEMRSLFGLWTKQHQSSRAAGWCCTAARLFLEAHDIARASSFQSTVWVWKMWAVILAVQLEMLFFQALTVNTIGVLDLQWKQLGHIIKPGATDKHEVLSRFFYLGFCWRQQKSGQVGVLPVGTDNPRKQSYK